MEKSKSKRVAKAIEASRKLYPGLDATLFVEGYAEPGYDKSIKLIVVGDFNNPTRFKDGQRIEVSDVPERLAKVLDKLKIETEWSDEWTACDECGGIVRTEPDSHFWKPAYRTAEHGNVYCDCCVKKNPELAED